MQGNQKVRLANGTELSADAGYANDNLWIWMDDSVMDLATAFRTFNDPGLTSRITYMITPDFVQAWEGFTRLTTLQHDEDGKIRIMLTKP